VTQYRLQLRQIPEVKGKHLEHKTVRDLLRRGQMSQNSAGIRPALGTGLRAIPNSMGQTSPKERVRNLQRRVQLRQNPRSLLQRERVQNSRADSGGYSSAKKHQMLTYTKAVDTCNV
jgi:hypothetical protein